MFDCWICAQGHFLLVAILVCVGDIQHADVFFFLFVDVCHCDVLFVFMDRSVNILFLVFSQAFFARRNGFVGHLFFQA